MYRVHHAEYQGNGGFSVNYVCKNCNTTHLPKIHCGREMDLMLIGNTLNWRCWKGRHLACCDKDSQFKFGECCPEPDIDFDLRLNELFLNKFSC